MKRKWLFIPLAVVVALALVVFVLEPEQRAAITSAIGLTSAPPPVAQRAKPICSQVIVPAGDCIPQHLANLPPDPGPAGMLTIEGIDSDKDGVRDDVQRFIAENFGDSPRAVKVLTMLAENDLMAVRLGGDLGREESQKLAQKIINAARCYSQVTPQLRERDAMQLVHIRVINTAERTRRAYAFETQLAHQVYKFGDETPTELCGFDPATIQ